MVLLSPGFYFSLEANACWTGCPRFRACYRRVEPRTPGHQENKGGQPQRRAGVKAGPQEVQSRLYLQEKACQVSQTFKCCAALSYYIKRAPLGLFPECSFRDPAQRAVPGRQLAGKLQVQDIRGLGRFHHGRCGGQGCGASSPPRPDQALSPCHGPGSSLSRIGRPPKYRKIPQEDFPSESWFICSLCPPSCSPWQLSYWWEESPGVHRVGEAGR